MSRRLLTGLLLVVLAAVVGGVWWATGGDTEELSGPGIAGPPAPGKSGAPGPRGGTKLTAEKAKLDTARQAGHEVAEEGPREGVASIRRPRWGRPRDAVWVTGRVDLPKGTPPGEDVVVEAEGSAFPNDPDGGRWHRVRIDDEGNFRVAFAPKTRYGRINIAARFVYLEERIKVELFDPENHNDLVITPKLGGLVVATVLAPRHAAFDADPLEGVTVAGAKGSGFGGEERDGWWTGREGEFEVGGLAPGEGYSIEARSPLWANGRTKDVEVREGQVTNVSVKLSLGAQLSGRVVDELGNVVTGGEVSAVPRGQGGGGMQPFRGATALATSDAADGSFELRGIPQAEVELVASANGYLDGKLEIGEVGDGTERHSLTIKVDSGGKLSGIVKWPWGDPAEDAIVRVVQSSSMGGRFEMDRVRGEVKVGADGAFHFSGLEPDQACNISAMAIHPDQRPKPGSKVSLLLSKKTPRWVDSVEKVDPGSPPLELELGPGDVLSGKCVDDAGEPLLHFAVLASPAGSSILSSSSRKPVRGRFRDESGEFHLKGVQAGEWEVKVSAPGHTDSERRRINVPHDGELIFNLSRTASITGSVYGSRGALEPGARVWAEHGGGKSTNATADNEGLFDLGRIYPGEVTLYADSDDAARSLPMVLRLGPGEEREDVTLRVQPGAKIVAQVHHEAGTREGRRITLRQNGGGDFPFGGGRGGGRNNANTDADGAVVFDGLDAGNYVLELQPERNPAWEDDSASWLLRNANQKKAEIEVSAGTTSTVTLGGPSPDRVIVTGRITVNGEPVAAGLVTAMDLETNQERPSSATNADDEGNYRLELDHPGRWRFSVRFGQGSWTTVTEEVSSGEHRIDFEIPEAKLTGILRGHDGQPLAETAVGMVDSESDGRRNDWFAQKNAVTNAEGRYEFDNLAPGTYYLRAGGGDGGFGFLRESKQEHGRVLVVVEVKEDSGEIEADIKLPLAGEIRGNVRNADGQPVAGARIRVQDSEGRNLSQFDFFRSGPDGSYTYGGVGPGRYLVTASRGEQSSGTETAKVYEGGTIELNLTLK